MCSSSSMNQMDRKASKRKFCSTLGSERTSTAAGPLPEHPYICLNRTCCVAGLSSRLRPNRHTGHFRSSVSRPPSTWLPVAVPITHWDAFFFIFIFVSLQNFFCLFLFSYRFFAFPFSNFHCSIFFHYIYCIFYYTTFLPRHQSP